MSTSSRYDFPDLKVASVEQGIWCRVIKGIRLMIKHLNRDINRSPLIIISYIIGEYVRSEPE